MLHHLKSKSSCFYNRRIILFLLINTILYARTQALASESDEPNLQQSEASKSQTQYANHKMDSIGGDKKVPRASASRSGRQYDGPISTSSTTGSYAALAGDTSAYVGQLPSSSGSYNSNANQLNGYSIGDLASAYQAMGASGNQVSAAYHSQDPMSMIARNYNPIGLASMHQPLPAGYPANPYPASPLAGLGGAGPLSAMFSPFASGSTSGTFPLISKGFEVTEIICTAVAVAIGAVIVGAPFILIYLFIMNQMNGGSGSGLNGMGQGGGGAISLTGPTSSTTVNGRKKRHTSFPEALLKQLSPLVNNEQVAQTFKQLMNSISKYQM